jgi:hypothetical protein
MIRQLYTYYIYVVLSRVTSLERHTHTSLFSWNLKVWYREHEFRIEIISLQGGLGIRMTLYLFYIYGILDSKKEFLQISLERLHMFAVLSIPSGDWHLLLENKIVGFPKWLNSVIMWAYNNE